MKLRPTTSSILSFGSIVRYQDNFFIFLLLSESEDTLYMLRVFNRKSDKSILNMIEAGRFPKDSLWLVYVVLKTEDFKDDFCTFVNNSHQGNVTKYLTKTSYSLDEVDKQAIKDAILNGTTVAKLREEFEKQGI